jgi:hypothetical protein
MNEEEEYLERMLGMSLSELIASLSERTKAKKKGLGKGPKAKKVTMSQRDNSGGDGLGAYYADSQDDQQHINASYS